MITSLLASPRNARRRHNPGSESLEARLVMTTIPYGVPYLEMSQVAATNAPDFGTTSLYLNFDGRSSQNVAAFYGTTGNIPRDIQEILFRTAQKFAPFNVQVKRAYGDNTVGAGAGATTLFIGDKLGNTSLLDDPNGGMWVDNNTRAYAEADYPSPGTGILHAPNSDPFNIGYVDPYSYNGPDDDYEPLNMSSWDNDGIARAAAHEAGHTFGLAHVLSNGQAEVMSYDAIATYFRNKSYPTTNLNADPGGGPAIPTPSLQPYWAYFWQFGNNWLLTPSPISLQNSYATLTATLGPRAVDGYANVADAGSVDPTYNDGAKHAIAVGGSRTGGITTSDHDVFTLTVGASQFVEVTVTTTGAGTLDPVLLVMKSSGKALAFYDDDSGPGLNSRLVFRALAGTTYSLIVGGYDGLSTGNYEIEVNAPNFPVNPANLPGGFAVPAKEPTTGGGNALSLGRDFGGPTGPLVIIPLGASEEGVFADANLEQPPPFPTRRPGLIRRAPGR